jgi:hypothetical protein
MLKDNELRLGISLQKLEIAPSNQAITAPRGRKTTHHTTPARDFCRRS